MSDAMKPAAIAIYLLIGLGVAVSMPPHEWGALAFALRALCWPFIAGAALGAV